MNKKPLLNLFSLFLIQGSNALFPLVLFPYLFVVFDKNTFSTIVVIESVMLYVLAFSLYSFDVTGVKYVGIVDDFKEKIEVLLDVLILRLFIFTTVCILTISIVFIMFPSHLIVAMLWMLFPLGMILQSNYFYQAIERNLFLAVTVFFCRLAAIVLAMFMVKGSNDLNLLVFILGGNYFLSGLITFLFLLIKFKISSYNISINRLLSRLYDGVGIYIGNISVSLFRGSNILLLSLVATPAAVAIYALAEKYIKTIQAVVRPLNQFAYPKVINDIKEDKTINHIYKVILKRTLPQVSILSTILLILLSVGFTLKANNYFPEDFELSFLVFAIMAFATVFGVCNYMFGTVGMNLIDSGQYYAKSIFIVGLLSVILTLYLGFYYKQYGAALVYTFSEAFLLVLFTNKFKGGK